MPVSTKDIKADNKRIAKNTLLLYIRMFVIMLVSLYTVRVTINVLGAEDYGIYNVVGSIATTMVFLTGTMTSATQRFFSYNLGRDDETTFNAVFCLAIEIFVVFAVFVLFVGFLLGCLLLNDFLVIPDERLYAARFVLGCSLLLFVFNMLSIPFTASIVAYERMDAFAYISIFDGLMKLLLVYLLSLVSWDKLMFYAILMLVEAVLVFLLYVYYCKKHFPVCRFTFIWDKTIFCELMSYMGWNLFGSASGMLVLQGQSILLNMFFGPLINAAKAVADKVNAALTSFTSNFYMAVSPQIVKNYAQGDENRMVSLAYKSSLLSFVLLFLLSVPIVYTMPDILSIWLRSENVSAEMISFSRLVLIFSMVTVLEPPLTQMIRATGQIKVYQISVGSVTLTFLPAAALILWLGAKPVATMYVLIVVYAMAHIVRLWNIKRMFIIPYARYLKEVLLPIIKLLVAVGPIILFLHFFVDIENVWVRLIVNVVAILVAITGIVFGLIFSDEERSFIVRMFKDKIFR